MIWIAVCCLAFVHSATSQVAKSTVHPWLVCPKGYHRAGPRCYLIVQKQMNWVAAQEHCEALGATLAATETKEEYFYLKSLMDHQIPILPTMKYDVDWGQLGHFWMAGYYNKYRQEALWYSSAPVSSRAKVTSWSSTDVRRNGAADYNCLFWDAHYKGWHFFPCTYLFFGAICEVDPIPVPVVG